MKKFRFLEHTADMYIEADGKTLEEAFSNAAEGVGFMTVSSDNVNEKIKKSFKIESENLESLLFDFLSKFLFFLDAENLVFHKVLVEKIEEKNKKWFLSAKAFGEEFNQDKHETGTHVKAITYHEMEIKKKGKDYIVKVLVDI